jgi:hypothetical protein
MYQVGRRTAVERHLNMIVAEGRSTAAGFDIRPARHALSMAMDPDENQRAAAGRTLGWCAVSHGLWPSVVVAVQANPRFLGRCQQSSACYASSSGSSPQYVEPAIQLSSWRRGLSWECPAAAGASTATSPFLALAQLQRCTEWRS